MVVLQDKVHAKVVAAEEAVVGAEGVTSPSLVKQSALHKDLSKVIGFVLLWFYSNCSTNVIYILDSGKRLKSLAITIL